MTTREAFFVYGKIASGKSSIWDSIATAYRQYDTPGQFHVISTEPERAYVIVEQHSDWADNITIYEPERTYEGLLDASKLAHDGATRDDWFIVDSIGACQDWVRNNWFESNLSKTWKEFQAGGGDPKGIEPHNWTQMNEMYKAWMLQYVLGFPGHRMAVAQADTLATISQTGKDWDKGHTRDTYGTIGYKPIGFKNDDYYFHSLWFANRTRTGELTLKTLKDKPGRRWLDHDQVLDATLGGFAVTYLLATAGWQVVD